VRTWSEYLGPVDGAARPPKRRVKAALDAIVGLAKRGPDYEPEVVLQARLAREQAERDKQDRINTLLTSSSISLEDLNKIADAQGAASAAACVEP
jgi:hypothetical protein